MSKLTDQINQDLKEAMKARDAVRLGVIRSLKSALTNASIEKGGLDTELDENEALGVVRKQVKQRQDSKEQFEQAGRDELAAKEAAEIEILEGYLPKQLSLEEIGALVEEAIRETGASSRADMGQLMKMLQQRSAGRADGKTLSQEVAKRLT